jgi:ABC-type multidrug transport system ATPase subunit
MKHLISLVDEAAEKIKDQDIIIFLGSTGAGKSTTIHFMASSIMRKVFVNGIPHIEPEFIPN